MPDEQRVLLTHEQSLALLAQAQSGDEQAKETLIVRNTGLVRSIAKSFSGRGIEFEDLMQIGCLGLIKAIDNFDISFEVRFSTYAVPMIAGEIKRSLRDDGMIKVSRSVKENAIKIWRAAEQYKKERAEEADIATLSSLTGLEKEEIVYCQDAIRAPVSINEPVFSENKTELIDTIKSEEGLNIEDKMLIEELIGKLEPRERQIIFLRYFLDKTQSEIAGQMGVSQVQISRLLDKTLKKLREMA